MCDKDPPKPDWIAVVSSLIIIFWLLILIANAKTVGAPKYDAPDEVYYYEHLNMPDAPTVSCCGVADVYYADKQEEGPNGQILAIITDTRPNDRVLPDGREVHRPAIPVGTKVPIPPSKIRKVPVPNPTDHTLIWMGENGMVYCYEPQTLY